MFESIAYIALGFASAFLSLEVGWHFTACKYKSLKPCFYKQIFSNVYEKSVTNISL
jgi:hypothetical protein